MARSFGAIRPDQVESAFPEGSFWHEASEQRFTMLRRDEEAHVIRHLLGPDGTPAEQREAAVHYWLGSGNHARGFVHRASSRKLTVLPVTWYAENGGHWGMNPTYDRPDHPGFDRRIDYRCLSCHAGYPEIEPGADRLPTGWQFPGRLVEGIDCERCHGPGGRHVEAARQLEGPQALRNSIVNPARLTPQRQTDICRQCHLGTPLDREILRFDREVFSYRPGEALADWTLFLDYPAGSGHEDRFEFVSSAYRLEQSACFRQSRGALTCTTCHNPHKSLHGQEAARHYSEVCRNCHAEKIRMLALADRHPASGDCVSCHMPKRTPSDAIHIRIADHFIRKRPEPDPPGPPIEHVGSHSAYRGEVVFYNPSDLPSSPENDLYLAVAQVTDQANLESGVVRLENLVKEHRPPQGEFYLHLADAWRKQGRLDKGGPWLVEAARRMPNDWRPLYALASAHASLGRFDLATELFRRASAAAPREPGPLAELGATYSRQGKLPEAIEAFRAAIQVDADFAEAHNGMGAALLHSGDRATAEEALREAVRLRPELAPMRTDLAVLLSMRGEFNEARHHFELALRLDPSFADGHSAYAGTLLANGMLAEARRHYQQALRVNPALPEAHHNLAVVLLQLGDHEAAIGEYQSAITYQPNYHAAHLGLARLLLSRGDRSAAEPHLRKASESPDVEVRREASVLLAQQVPK